MKYYYILIFSLCTFLGTAQNCNITSSIFPEKCLGTWEGTMHIFNNGMLRDSIKIKFTAAKTDSVGTYVWKTEYLSPTHPMVKDYKLVVLESKTGRYILDEGEGTELPLFNVNNKMYSTFKVSNILLTSSYELINDTLIFEVTSGVEIPDGKEITSYSTANVQQVVLKRSE